LRAGVACYAKTGPNIEASDYHYSDANKNTKKNADKTDVNNALTHSTPISERALCPI